MWVTRDGTEIVIADMDDGHIRNAIAMLERSAAWGLQVHQLEALSFAAQFRHDGEDGGSMAAYYADQAADYALEMSERAFLFECTPYGDLVDEMERRKAAGTWVTIEVTKSLVDVWMRAKGSE